jgi:hypothetical protein
MRNVILVVAVLALSCTSPSQPIDVAPPMQLTGQIIELEDVDGTNLGPGVMWVRRLDGTWAMRLIMPFSSCGATCSSGIECSFGVLKPCPFCNFGSCKNTRPE